LPLQLHHKSEIIIIIIITINLKIKWKNVIMGEKIIMKKHPLLVIFKTQRTCSFHYRTGKGPSVSG
jgi:hypothetical protein